jgi:EmrB/QacA subfamily drug resistance transporter
MSGKMSERMTGPSRAVRLVDIFSGGWEPAPAEFIARRSYYPWLVAGTTCIAAFIGQLDASIVQLTLPTLEHEFLARLSAVSWVAIAYQLAYAAFLPVFARLAEIAGRKVMYLIGFTLFTLASLLCGFASDLIQLIAFRVLLGIAGAMLGANSIVILVKAAGPQRLGRAMGIFAAAQAIGVSMGPVTGGVLLATLGWRWVFWAGVPFALAGAVIGWLVIPQTGDLRSDRQFDWQGAVLLTPALTLLLIVISLCHAWGPTSPAIIGSAVATAVLLAMFIRQERRVLSPLIDLDLFRAIAFAGGILAIVLSYAMLYGIFFLMSFALVRGFHYSPLGAGLRLAIIPVVLGVVAPFSGALHERLGVRTVLVSGMAVCVAALMLLSVALTGTGASVHSVMIALAIFGAGLGIFIAPNNSATLNAAPRDRSGEAGGLLNLMRVFGTSLGVAGASAVLSWRLAAATGIGDRTLAVSEEALLGAVTDGLLLLAVFAVIAGITSVLRGPPRAPVLKAAA